MTLIAFHKPYGVLSQFTSGGGKATLAEHIAMPGVYAAGRLDHDSEGLLLLTDDGRLQKRIADPSHRLAKRYLAQVEGSPDAAALERFADGLWIGDGAERFRALPARAVAIAPPMLDERTPPIRRRAAIPTTWIEVALHEGRNRQVRRMTAAIGHPTLRLVRIGIGDLDLFALDLPRGAWKRVDPARLGLEGSRHEAGSGLSTSARNRRY